MTTNDTCSCGLCGKPTRMTGTKRCDGCWELESRIRRDPEIARRILHDLQAANMDGEPMSDTDALDQITDLLSGQEWESETPGNVAAIVRLTGRAIEDVA